MRHATESGRRGATSATLLLSLLLLLQGHLLPLLDTLRHGGREAAREEACETCADEPGAEISISAPQLSCAGECGDPTHHHHSRAQRQHACLICKVAKLSLGAGIASSSATFFEEPASLLHTASPADPPPTLPGACGNRDPPHLL
ncbi:MAG: hypothetical protein ACE5GW_05595 [Planctomycetota bacterium]